jgi:hypothetical protein
MSVQEKYVSLLELANANGTTYELSEGDGVLHVNGTAPSDEAKAELWAEYERLDPDFASSDLILNVTTGSGDAGGGANRDILHHPDKIYPGQELKIP